MQHRILHHFPAKMLRPGIAQKAAFRPHTRKFRISQNISGH